MLVYASAQTAKPPRKYGAGGIDGLVKLLSDNNHENESRPKGADPQTRLAPVLMFYAIARR
jgi:hypothetical protein